MAVEPGRSLAPRTRGGGGGGAGQWAAGNGFSPKPYLTPLKHGDDDADDDATIAEPFESASMSARC